MKMPWSRTPDALSESEETDGRHIELRTLAPNYDVGQHSTYLRHLEDAVADPKNRNIALTGRYGSGKSSVLDAFEDAHKESTVRISINTLGPDETDDDLTNRIQKELVKQLVYRLEPGQVRRSRFARPKRLTQRRAFGEALIGAVIALGLAWLFGLRPTPPWSGAGTLVQIGAGVAILALVTVAAWAVRWLVGDRNVSEVTTAFAGIALKDGPDSYFDDYLGEIVEFFETVEPDFVIFEDLDRFDDPQIFDSLYELNTLVNASSHRQKKDQPLRFIYAIKDSLFEQLGEEPRPKDERRGDDAASDPSPRATRRKHDAAAAAVRRANRTKFFELVIPIVPFMTHRSARDLLADQLVELGFAKDFVSRPLLDLVAKHTTDMRLMVNVCNEFAVFVERLMWTPNPAPGMTADHLFALVAYKNFHLADFEDIARRASMLDRLDESHRDRIRSLIKNLERQRRIAVAGEADREAREQTATELGDRLGALARLLPRDYRGSYNHARVGGETFSRDAFETVDFWARVSEAESLALAHPGNQDVTLDAKALRLLFPGAMDVEQWRDPQPAEVAELCEHVDGDIRTLRGADFAALAAYDRANNTPADFDDRVGNLLASELARDLVRRGFITRNYAEYSAVFYGSFVGVDVAYFYNHAVQPNEMYLDYQFTTDNAISNLLDQVPADFTSSVSALNIQVADFLLVNREADADRLVEYLVTHDSDEVAAFLDAFFNSPEAQRERLVERLTARPWPAVFDYLTTHPGIPDEETRVRLVDAALLRAMQVDRYTLGEPAQAWVRSSYPRLTVVRETQAAVRTDLVFELLSKSGVTVADLRDLGQPLRQRVVAEQTYELTAANLRVALGIDGVPDLDQIRRNPDVWAYCEDHITDYLAAMTTSAPDEPVVRTPSVLIDIIDEQHETWTAEELHEVIRRSASTAAIETLTTVPEVAWPALMEAGLVVPTFSNVFMYVQTHGVDGRLRGFLVPNGHDPIHLRDIEEADPDERTAFAVRLLNAGSDLAASTRVQVVRDLQLDSPVDPTEIDPAPDQLLARALEAEVLPDTFETFAHFASGGWRAVSEAFAVSKHVTDFFAPDLVDGFAAELLESDSVPEQLRRAVVDDLANYVPNDDAEALHAAGMFASKRRIRLPLDDIRRISRVTKAPEAVLRQLTLDRAIGADDIISVLVPLGSPYDTLAEGEGAEFDLPLGNSNKTLFTRLEEAGVVLIVSKRRGQGQRIKVLR